MTPSRGRNARSTPQGRRHHRLWLALLALPPLVIGIGTVFLADNLVPPTSAGVVATSPHIPTTLALDPPAMSADGPALSATLTAGGSGIGGENLAFQIGSTYCTAETGTTGTKIGVATCTISSMSGLPGDFTVSFAGKGALEGSSATWSQDA